MVQTLPMMKSMKQLFTAAHGRSSASVVVRRTKKGRR